MAALLLRVQTEAKINQGFDAVAQLPPAQQAGLLAVLLSRIEYAEQEDRAALVDRGLKVLKQMQPEHDITQPLGGLHQQAFDLPRWSPQASEYRDAAMAATAALQPPRDPGL